MRLHGAASPFELSLYVMTAAVMKVSPRFCMVFVSMDPSDHCASTMQLFYNSRPASYQYGHGTQVFESKFDSNALAYLKPVRDLSQVHLRASVGSSQASAIAFMTQACGLRAAPHLAVAHLAGFMSTCMPALPVKHSSRIESGCTACCITQTDRGIWSPGV